MIRTPTLAALAAYFLRLGAVGFGGPAALTDRMRRDLVDDRRWISREEFELGLTIAAACPGPLAYQLAVYCGVARHGTAGALVVGLAFAAAPFALVAGFAAGYEYWEASPVVRALFHGAAPVIVMLVARACWNLARKTLHRTAFAWVACGLAAVVTWATGREPLWVLAAAGLLGIPLLRPAWPTPPPGQPPPPASPAGLSLLSVIVPPIVPGQALDLFLFFFKTGCLVFGSGLVIVPMLRATVVHTNAWLTETQFLDAVTVGLVSPGPVVITATFVGHVVAGLRGAMAATAGMFLPAVLFTIVAAPWFARHRASPGLMGFVRGITAAVVGVLAGTVPLIATAAVTDLPAAAIMLATLALLLWRRPPADPVLVGLGALAGLGFAWFRGLPPGA